MATEFPFSANTKKFHYKLIGLYFNLSIFFFLFNSQLLVGGVLCCQSKRSSLSLSPLFKMSNEGGAAWQEATILFISVFVILDGDLKQVEIIVLENAM